MHVAKIATEFRQKFQKPVVIDMFCYRRFGHNESDEPAFTQPLMYRAIKAHPSVVEIYSKRLIEEGVITKQGVEEMQGSFRAHLEAELGAADGYKPNKADWLDGRWSDIGFADDEARRGTTGVPIETLKEIGRRITTIPQDFHAHKTVQRLLQRRREMVETGTGIDWSMAEALAFGTLLKEGFPVRLSGQDSERGTFSQRHSVLVDQETERRYTPLKYVSPDQGRFEVINSMLSEEAVLAFEYGYTLAEPNALVMWEAQFGDFANGAQVVFDQFISSGERKWLRMSGLVCLLPHGYEGQGPEHSSARLERFLQTVRGGQLAGRQLHDARQLLPHPAPPAASQVPQAAGDHDAEVAAAAQARHLRPDRYGAGLLVPSPAVGRRAGAAQREDQAEARRARSAASCCARARSTTTSTRPARRPASTMSTCCASSSSIRSRPRRW